jgi:fumarate reductase flavoprotein subunit
MSFDILIIGAGFAGLTAANRAIELGLKPLVLEACPEKLYPCNSRFSTGSLHVAFQTPWTNAEQLSATIISNAKGAARNDLAGAIGKNAARTIDWLKDHGAKFEDHPRRTDHMPMLSPLREMRAGLDWEGGGANKFLKRLGDELTKHGGELRRATRAQRLININHKVTGVEVITEERKETLFAKSIIIADGGFQANAELVRQHIGCNISDLQTRNAGTGLGDGIRMATELGAATLELDSFYGHVLSRDAMTNEKLWPYPQVDLICATGIVVNSDGKRFADEGLGGIFMANAIAKLDNPLSAVAIFDSRVWEDARTTDNVPPNPSLPDAGGTVIEAGTLGELANAANINKTGLLATVSSYNQYVEFGSIPSLDPTRTRTTHVAQPILDPPFYAIPLCAGITVTSGGLSVNGKGQVMDKNDCSIAGLYAAGSTVGGLEGGPNASYVGGLIKSFCIGLIAAETIAAEHGSP